MSSEEMAAARLDYSVRDECAPLLIKLNQCRQRCFYLPFKCVDQRHAYEKCEYDLYVTFLCYSVNYRYISCLFWLISIYIRLELGLLDI